MRRFLCALLILLMLLPFSSCTREEPQTDTVFLMDTLITITLYAPREVATPIFAECRALLCELDALWSRTKEESDVSAFLRAESGVTLDPRTAALLQTALDVSARTDGAFDVTVAPLVELWKACEEAGHLPESSELQEALSLTDWSRLQLTGTRLEKDDPRVRIDLGGIGKGAAISILLSYLESTDAAGGMVSFGSNVAVFGQKTNGETFRVAVRNPVEGKGGYAAILSMRTGEVLSVSGDYERFYTIDGERYHHILDPKTGYPSESGLCSVAVVCADGALADALSTALFVMGEEKALAFYETGVYTFEAIFVSSDGSVRMTEGLTERLSQ